MLAHRHRLAAAPFRAACQAARKLGASDHAPLLAEVESAWRPEPGPAARLN